jgi:hypothetical protein
MLRLSFFFFFFLIRTDVCAHRASTQLLLMALRNCRAELFHGWIVVMWRFWSDGATLKFVRARVFCGKVGRSRGTWHRVEDLWNSRRRRILISSHQWRMIRHFLNPKLAGEQYTSTENIYAVFTDICATYHPSFLCKFCVKNKCVTQHKSDPLSMHPTNNVLIARLSAKSSFQIY